MPKGQRKSAYQRFTTGKTELQNFTINELYEIIEGLVKDLSLVKIQLAEKNCQSKKTPQTIKLSEEDFDLLMNLFSKKQKREKKGV